MGDQALQFAGFGRGEFAVFAEGQLAEVDIHDADPVQLGDLVVQELAHPSDLPVEALGEDDPECVGPEGFDFTFFRHGTQDGESVAHALDELRGDGRLDGDDILLVVLIAGAKDLVDDVPVIRQEDEALGGLVQSADRKEALLVTDEGDDVFRLFRVCGTDDADWLVEGDIQGLRFCLERFAIDADDIAGIDPVAGAGGLVVDGHPAGVDQPISFPTRADAGLADVFVEADGVVVKLVQMCSGIRSLEEPKIAERQVPGGTLRSSRLRFTDQNHCLYIPVSNKNQY